MVHRHTCIDCLKNDAAAGFQKCSDCMRGKPMTNKYKIGSQWTTRGGWVAMVLKVHPSGEYPILTWHDNGDDVPLIHLNVDGLAVCEMEDEYDIIEPYVEPRSGWVNVFMEKCGDISYQMDLKSRNHADSLALGTALNETGIKRIACVKWTEGEGLEGEDVGH